MAMAQLHYRQTQVTIEHRERETAMFYAFFSLFLQCTFFDVINLFCQNFRK